MNIFQRGATLFLIACTALSVAQSTVPENSLVIGAGDAVRIHVLDTPELDQTVHVDDRGDAPLLLIGLTHLGGLTPQEAAEAVQRGLRLGNYMIDPHVTVTLEKSATQNVTVIGQVRLPGAYSIETPRTALDLIAMAGGLNDLADRNIVIERSHTKETISFFVDNDAEKSIQTNVTVFPGDRIVVPKAPIVYMLGFFAKPGGYARTTNSGKVSLLQAVAEAGDLSTTAKGNSTRLLRKRPDGTVEVRMIALTDIEKGKSPDFLLQPDDVVYVPFSIWKKVEQDADVLFATAATAAVYRF